MLIVNICYQRKLNSQPLISPLLDLSNQLYISSFSTESWIHNLYYLIMSFLKKIY